MKSSNVINFDETRVCITTDQQMVFEATEKDRCNVHGQYPTPLGTMVPFVIADGKVLAVFWILKCSDEGKVTVRLEPKHNTRCHYPRYYGYTTSGYLNKEIFSEIMDVVVDLWKPRSKDEPCWIFCDQLASHMCHETNGKCLEQKVYLWLLPSNTSHFLQPLEK